jgi:hypothetical protein
MNMTAAICILIFANIVLAKVRLSRYVAREQLRWDSMNRQEQAAEQYIIDNHGIDEDCASDYY